MLEPRQDLKGLNALGVFAHPDDEGFGCGGTLAMLAARGARVTLACGTNGDVGEISDPALATPENLWKARQQELLDAMAVTGVKDVRFFNYRDSGMDGTPDNRHPKSLFQAAPEEVMGRIASLIREVRPQFIITHDPTGGYGHPDHKAIQRHTAAAFNLAGVRNYQPPDGSRREPWLPRLLYYFCVPRSRFLQMWEEMRRRGIKPPFASLEVEKLGSPDEEVTTTLDVAAYVDTKIQSLACHRTQIDPKGPFAQLPPEVTREFMSVEYFTLALPKNTTKTDDLLAKLAS